ncbi:MAG: threonine--tRNA ligase [Bacillota bacterium]
MQKPGWVRVELPGGRTVEVLAGTTVGQMASQLGNGVGQTALAGRIKGKLVGLDQCLEEDTALELLDFSAPGGREVYRHTAAHILAQAVKRLFPGVKLGIGPAIEDGFYYDFEVEAPFTPEDLAAIEQEMARIVAEDYTIERQVFEKDRALEHFAREGEPYKVELIQDLPEGVEITCYRQGDFLDLCAGPHLQSTGRLGAFKLLTVAGAYWRGDERRPMLQRIYGTAFERPEDLEAHLHRLEEQKRRDHRRLGRELDLYSVHEEGGAGLVYWHPRGALVRQLIEDFWRKVHRERGYDIIYSPHIAKVDLWKTSGHWNWYKDSMYSPIEIDEVEYLLKPMNCPFHIMIYKTQTRSYRELPLRWAELGTVYRYERSGALHGLLRVRGFTQDDAHLFCRPDQLEDELVGVVDLAEFMMRTFGYQDYDIMLSVRDPDHKEKYIGEDDVWEQAEGALLGALRRKNLDYVIGEGEAQFYGPKIDITLKDSLGRGWQGPTIQVDFNLPERFDLSYMGEDGSLRRPVMIHRTVLGSMERFFGGLIEHYAGAFPVWLAPVQVVVVPIADRHAAYAGELFNALRGAGIRGELDLRNEKVGFKIRWHEVQRVPYMLVVGDREVEGQSVSVRERGVGDRGRMALKEFIAEIAPKAGLPF